MNKKLSLFPMTRDQCAIPRFAAMLQGYQISHCFTAPFKRLDGADTSRIDGGDATGHTLTSFDQAQLAYCDILFVDYDPRMNNMETYQTVIDAANNMGKEVLLSRLLAQKLNPQPEVITTLTHKTEAPETDAMYEISVPVIMVLSQGSHTDQFATELALREYFTDVGYKVSQIGSLQSSMFFGFSGIPPFLYETRDAYEKALYFNHYANMLVSNEGAELVIIGAPGAIAKYGNQQLQGLGLLPQIICSGVKSDSTVLCMYQGEYSAEIFDMLHSLTDYKLDSPVNFFSIANVLAKPDDRYNGIKLEYIDLNTAFVLDSIQDMAHGDFVVYNALSKESAYQAGMAIQAALTDNVDNVS